ncbi:CAAX amino terminal protease family protein, partial [gut metagenome]
MKTALKLVLLDLLFVQVVAPVLIVIPFAFYLWVTTGGVDEAVLMRLILIPAQLTGLLLMAVYLWMSGYISKQRDTWQLTSVPFLFYSGIAIFTIGFWISTLMEQLDWIPNLMEQSFDILQSGWGGIIAIALLGPIVEELLFRGAIFQALLKDYSPMKAIFLSSFLFAVFHLNPAQMIPAFLMGVLLTWACFKTRSLIPSIWMHI